MKSRYIHSFVLSAACGAVIGLAGCSNEDSGRNATALDVKEVKGVRFDAPEKPAELTGTALQAPSEELAMLTPAPTATPEAAPIETAQAAPETTVTVISTGDIVADPAADPIATPAPIAALTATPEPVAAPDATTTDPTTAMATAGAAQPAPAGPTPEIPKVSTTPGEFTPIPFAVLAGYKYVEPIPVEGEKPEDVEKRRASGQIPPEILALDGANAQVEGWMVPLEITDEGHVKSFILVNKPPECCFGDMQAMNEWIDVVMEPGKHAEFNVDRPVKVSGKLEVGEKTEDGFVLSVYRMKAENAQL